MNVEWINGLLINGWTADWRKDEWVNCKNGQLINGWMDDERMLNR